MKMQTYTDEELKEAVASSPSIRQVIIKLGLNPKGGGSYRVIHSKIKTLCIDTSHFKGQAWNKGQTKTPKHKIKDYLSNSKSITSHRLRLRLIKEGLMKHECSSCHLTYWMGSPIPIELDHIDGNHYNNELSNLRLLCPNCHSLTPTHAGKNKGKASYSAA
jgi:5-methylcytosine-specific restriction endonuclease McrA